MTTPRYLPVETFQAWARDDITADETLIETAINTSEEWLDDKAGRSLILVDDDTVATARKFRPERCTDELLIPDLAEITSVVENGTTLTADVDYQAEPFDNLDPSSQQYRPFDKLVRLDHYWYTNGRRPTVTVTGKWGWTSIPAVVVTACEILTNDWLQNRNVSLGVVGSTTEGFSIGVRQNPNVLSAIHTIRGHKSWGLA